MPEPQAVKAYALLRAILNTAVREDEIIRQNPCRIKGYDQYHTPERPTATIAQVYALADAVPARFSALILVAALSGLRWGELVALRRRDIDLDAGTVRVARKLAALRSHLEFGPPKSAAGVRVVALPAAAVDALMTQMSEHTADGPDALVFTGDKGALLRSGNFGRAVKWTRTVAALGLPGFHFHDLRHTGNTLAAASGASGAAAADGPREHEGRVDLPARDQRAGPRDRLGHGPADRPADPAQGRPEQLMAYGWPTRSERGSCQPARIEGYRL